MQGEVTGAEPAQQKQKNLHSVTEVGKIVQTLIADLALASFAPELHGVRRMLCLSLNRSLNDLFSQAQLKQFQRLLHRRAFSLVKYVCSIPRPKGTDENKGQGLPQAVIDQIMRVSHFVDLLLSTIL